MLGTLSISGGEMHFCKYKMENKYKSAQEEKTC
jgi:hypothetical protein